MRAGEIRRGGGLSSAADSVVLDYEDRLLRRKRIETVNGHSVMVDLAETVSLSDGDALVCDTGEVIAVKAAIEPLLKISGDLARLAWHIGNRHTPCQVVNDHLLIRHDPVLAKMLIGLGAEVSHVMAAFTPEGGAYGHGRTMGHAH